MGNALAGLRAEVQGVIDLHCHILPGLDDGPDDENAALEMAALAEADGVRQIVTTPHFVGENWPAPALVLACLDELRQRLATGASPLALSSGGEVLLEPGLPARLAAGELPLIDRGPYVLVEIPFVVSALPDYASFALAELKVAGLRPILAHPERCFAFQKDPSLPRRLVEQGLVMQVNALSLTGGHGGAARRCAEAMLRAGLVHVIASDGHDPHERPPVLSQAVARAGRLVGEAAAVAMVTSVPTAILAGGEVSAPEPVLPTKRRWWFLPRLERP
jgi:protein-tyrosine phosphatase